jgi:hypothetical protein
MKPGIREIGGVVPNTDPKTRPGSALKLDHVHPLEVSVD